MLVMLVSVVTFGRCGGSDAGGVGISGCLEDMVAVIMLMVALVLVPVVVFGLCAGSDDDDGGGSISVNV